MEARDRATWRAWLKKHHAVSDGVWLVYYKKHSGKPSVSYDEAVEEAICFGWIDSTVNRIDEARYMQRYTQRKPRSLWSDLNISRARKMIRCKKMTAAGMEKFGLYLADPDRYSVSKRYALPEALPEDLMMELKKRKGALLFFESCPASYRNMVVRWIGSAKREETRKKRVMLLATQSAEGRRVTFM